MLNGLKNIVSLSLLIKENHEFFFINNASYIYFCNKLVGTKSLVSGVYYLNMNDRVAMNGIFTNVLGMVWIPGIYGTLD